MVEAEFGWVFVGFPVAMPVAAVARMVEAEVGWVFVGVPAAMTVEVGAEFGWVFVGLVVSGSVEMPVEMPVVVEAEFGWVFFGLVVSGSVAMPMAMPVEMAVEMAVEMPVEMSVEMPVEVGAEFGWVFVGLVVSGSVEMAVVVEAEFGWVFVGLPAVVVDFEYDLFGNMWQIGGVGSVEWNVWLLFEPESAPAHLFLHQCTELVAVISIFVVLTVVDEPITIHLFCCLVRLKFVSFFQSFLLIDLSIVSYSIYYNKNKFV
jgi:hypothetical protein